MAIKSSTTNNGREVTIEISGSFDFSQHQAFRTICDKAGTTVQRFIIDLGAAEYVDSSALGMLLVLRDRVGGNRDKVRLTRARPEVKKILEIANFDQLFTIA